MTEARLKKDWPIVRLGEILRQAPVPVAVQADGEYPNFGVYSFGRGLFRKPPISGGSTSATTLYKAKAGQFVYSRLFAFEGAYGLVSSEFDGYYVSNEFPLFDCDPDRVLPEFIAAYVQQPLIWKSIATRAIGVGHRRQRVQPAELGRHELSLPPLAEQWRILARVQALGAPINHALVLRQQAITHADSLVTAMAHGWGSDATKGPPAGWRRMRLADCIRLVDQSQRVSPHQSYPNLGIYSFGRGLFKKRPIDGSTTSATVLRRVSTGQFIYSRLFAFEGAFGMVPSGFDDHFVSNEYPTFECDPSLVRVEFLAAYFKAPSVWKEVSSGSKGLGHRRQRVQPRQLLDDLILVPPLGWQERIAKVQSEVEKLRELQLQSGEEINTLLALVLERSFRGRR